MTAFKFFFSHSLQCLHTSIVHVLFKIIGWCNIIFLLVLKATTHLSTYLSRLAQAWYIPQSKLWYKNQEFPKVLADRTTLIFYSCKFTELKFNFIPSASTEDEMEISIWSMNCETVIKAIFYYFMWYLLRKYLIYEFSLEAIACKKKNCLSFYQFFFLDKKTLIYQIFHYLGCWRTQI